MEIEQQITSKNCFTLALDLLFYTDQTLNCTMIITVAKSDI